MNPESYWYRYFAARRDVELYVGLGAIAFALISIISGSTLVRFQGLIYRAENPQDFWKNVATVGAIGTVFLGLFFFGPS